MDKCTINFIPNCRIAALILLWSWNLVGQDIIWSNKILDVTDRFQFENNSSELVLGPPTIYPSKNFEDPHDPFSEGYIVHYQNTKIKNVFSVSFPTPSNARQVVIGGIFNMGTISEIEVILKNNQLKSVYKSSELPSKVKFKTFAVQIPYNTVYGLIITLDHSKINSWNIIKGLGISNAQKLYEISPALVDTSHTHKKEIIGRELNSTDCYEFNPKISPDGKTLYFVKECANVLDQDIWFAERDSIGKWGVAKNIGIPLNNSGHNFVASISPDGQTLLIGNSYKPDGTIQGDGVSTSQKDENGNWAKPTNIDIPGYENLNDHSNFYLNNEGNVLLMALQDKSSVGDLDLYASIYNKNLKSWSAPINLGFNVNTVYQEDYPYLANDGVTLYFSSKGGVGYGGLDIYMSKRLDDTYTKWSKPLNLGPFVNSKSDDKGFVIASEGDHAYFNSATFNDDVHNMDIFKVDLPKILNQIPNILITGTCTEAISKSPLRALIYVKDNEDNIIAYCASNPKTGSYVMSVPAGKTYNISGEVLEHFNIKEKLNLTEKNLSINFTKNFSFKAFMDTGTVYKMENILFENKSANLIEQSYPELDKIFDMMMQQSKSSFEVSGHTDNVGAVAANEILSNERVNTVINYLVSKGVKMSRIRGIGKGETEPIADNETEEGRSINRRVEFKVLVKDLTLKKPSLNKNKSTKTKKK